MTWRPFEPSRETTEAADRAREQNRCNRHDDCARAEENYRNNWTTRGTEIPAGFHCHDECCEECFGS